MKVSKHFHDYEFIHPSVYNNKRLSNLLFISEWQINFAEFIRERYGLPVIINDWKWNGNFKESGTRDFLSSTGAIYSQHKFKAALDMKVKGKSANEIRKDIMKNQELFYNMGLRRIESDRLAPTWFHADCANTGEKNKNKIVIFG